MLTRKFQMTIVSCSILADMVWHWANVILNYKSFLWLPRFSATRYLWTKSLFCIPNSPVFNSRKKKLEDGSEQGRNIIETFPGHVHIQKFRQIGQLCCEVREREEHSTKVDWREIYVLWIATPNYVQEASKYFNSSAGRNLSVIIHIPLTIRSRSRISLYDWTYYVYMQR